MPMPTFTADEQYLLNSLKSSAAKEPNVFMWGYLLGCSLLFALAVYYSEIPFMTVSFIVLCGFRFYEDQYSRKWTPLWRSIIDKYEAAIPATNDSLQRS
jgi:hypothetical protein